MPRNCRACQHAERQAIEADLRVGLSYRDIARRYNISKDVICRHRASHVSLHSTPALTTVTKIVALLDDAEAASTWNFSLLSVREARHCVEELYMQLNHGIEC
jgi:hypothetical protein